MQVNWRWSMIDRNLEVSIYIDQSWLILINLDHMMHENTLRCRLTIDQLQLPLIDPWLSWNVYSVCRFYWVNTFEAFGNFCPKTKDNPINVSFSHTLSIGQQFNMKFQFLELDIPALVWHSTWISNSNGDKGHEWNW